MTVKTGLLTETKRAAAVRNLPVNLLILPPPGLSAIKENDLHTNVGTMSPKHCKDKYPKPPARVKATEQTRKKARSEKTKEKKREKLNKIQSQNIRNIVGSVFGSLVSLVENGDQKCAPLKAPSVPIAATA